MDIEKILTEGIIFKGAKSPAILPDFIIPELQR